MIAIRSLAYHVLFIGWTLIISLGYLPLLLCPRWMMQRAAYVWLGLAQIMQRWVLGLSYEVRGLENLPAGAVLIAAKHQSAWDTMVFHHLVADPAFVLKKELLSIPFVGWYLAKSGQVAVDRKAGMKALKYMVEGAHAAAAESRQIIIFPEGHRQAPGTTGDYHSGVAMLYAGLDVPLVPVALNSGMFWGRNAFLHYPGVITLQVLPPIPHGLNRRAFMDRLESTIETATRALEAEALQRFPYLTARVSPTSATPVDNSVE
ncbi:MAG TPA: lysophospholipid acyltransferase family protein [Patescibacteria group bacterium]|nr:lysophospholipid acyltransferase family protein [Patescibacteria group bacterium]